MRLLRLSVAITLLALFATEGTGRAQVHAGSEDVPAVSDAPMGKHSVRRGVQGPAGLLTLRLNLLVNASSNSFFKPTSLAPDMFYSITDNVQIGLLHTGPMGWQTLPGAGLCLTGSGTGGCPEVYNNVGFDFMYGLLYGDFHLSLHSSLFLMSIADPLWTMWTVGLTGKLHFSDVVALFFDPQIGITLSNRSIYEDYLFVPVELQFQAAPAVSVKVLTGITGQLSGFGDNYRVPLGLGVVGNVSPNIDLGLRFSFDNLLGNVPDGVSRSAERSIGLLMNLRF